VLKSLHTKCILVGSPLTLAKVPRWLDLCVFYVIGKKKRLSIILLMVSGHIPIMPYKKKECKSFECIGVGNM
jgi:hypothetical protein